MCVEWRSGKSGHLPLQDEDVTTEVVHGWKKVNTLAHYHVPDGAVMALVQKRHKTDGVRTVHGHIEITGSNGMQPIITMEEGQKVWHLVSATTRGVFWGGFLFCGQFENYYMYILKSIVLVKIHCHFPTCHFKKKNPVMFEIFFYA